MLFRLLQENDHLQSQRESFIQNLNAKISLIKLDVSIVFDASFQIGEGSRSHFDALEIVFSAQDETADEYIIDELKNSSNPRQETVVTSDKNLARQARNCYAHTESVEKFNQWLDKTYKNKLQQIKKRKKDINTLTSPLVRPAKSSSKNLPLQNGPLEAYSEYYQKIFESNWQEILLKEKKEEEQKSLASPLSKSKKAKRKTRRMKDPFKILHPLEEDEVNEMQRWLKIFENRFHDLD